MIGVQRGSLFGLFVVMVGCFPIAGSAQPYIPSFDFRDVMQDGYENTKSYIQLDTDPPGHYREVRDRVRFTAINPACGPPDCLTNTGNGSGVMFASSGPGAGNMTLTTIYGVDANPGSSNDDALITGFTASAPEWSVTDETYLSLVGDYVAETLGTAQIGALASFPAFADFDLSRFVGNPTSVVYAFRSVVPISEFEQVPEPSAAMLVMAGAVTVCGVARNRRRRNRD